MKLKKVTITGYVDETLASDAANRLQGKAQLSGHFLWRPINVEVADAPAEIVAEVTRSQKTDFARFPIGTKVQVECITYGDSWGIERPFPVDTVWGKVIGHRHGTPLSILVEFSLKSGLKTRDDANYLPDEDRTLQFYYAPTELKKKGDPKLSPKTLGPIIRSRLKARSKRKARSRASH